MKNAILVGIAVLFCISAFCDECWSTGFRFDGSEITEEAILLKPTDPLAYSSALAEGEPKSLTINVEDTANPEISASIFADYSETAVEGTTTWDYTDEDFKDFPTDDTYLLTETVTSEIETKVLTRMVTILPEPMGLLIVAFIGALALRKKIKSLIAVLTIIALSSFSAKADGIVSNVNCLQMWPFDRSVVINYTLTSTSTNPVFNVKFYGSLDNGETTFNLAENGTITRDGANGTIAGTGEYKTIWTPDESFYETYSDNMLVKVEATEQTPPPPPGSNTYMIVDLSGGTNAASFAISYLDDVPEGGWMEEYKTTKLVLRKIKAGKFIMGSPNDELGRKDDEDQHEVTLTKDFYIGVFETTQKQYELITEVNPSRYEGSARPVECVSYNTLRGDDKGAGWPTSYDVDDDSFFGILRAKTQVTFDLPTEAQWEYACRAGTTTALNSGKNLTDEDQCAEMDEVGRYNFNEDDGKGGYYIYHTTVGSYLPNAWGLYDMHGNVWEYCLDWYGSYDGDATDPKGRGEGDDNGRVKRGGSQGYYAATCRSANRMGESSSLGNSALGFRVALTISDEPAPEPEKYMVVDLSGGTNATSFAISYLDDVPEGGWTEEYKTTKMVLRKIEPDTFMMGSRSGEVGRLGNEIMHDVILTNTYYIGIFETTQKQYELITGYNFSKYKGDVRPVESVWYKLIRGNCAGWPTVYDVEETSFMGILRSKTKMFFDLPTEAQWEFACRAGTTTALNSGKNLSDENQCDEMAEVGRYLYNGGGDKDENGKYNAHTAVGSYLPNNWGLYDMHGNVQEMCLDKYTNFLDTDWVTEPLVPTKPGDVRIVARGGSWGTDASSCRSASRLEGWDGYGELCGLRVIIIKNMSLDQDDKNQKDFEYELSFKTENTLPIFKTKFYGKLNDGTEKLLDEMGELEYDGASGIVAGTGKHKLTWIPDEAYTNIMDEVGLRVEYEDVTEQANYLVLDTTSNKMRVSPDAPDTDDDLCRTDELWLRRIEPGTFTMGSPEDELGRYSDEIQHEVTLTKAYYIGVFEITQKQCQNLIGTNLPYYNDPSFNVGDNRPVESISFNMIRGEKIGSAWPKSNEVDEKSFIGQLRKKAGNIFDLPTEAQWEYACRAGTTTALNNGKTLSDEYECDEMAEVGRYSGNEYDGKGEFEGNSATVGSYLPNAWGLYDMHGNVEECCLDWWIDLNGDPAIDPKGGEEGETRIYRGGCFYWSADECRSACRSGNSPDCASDRSGFRVVLVP